MKVSKVSIVEIGSLGKGWWVGGLGGGGHRIKIKFMKGLQVW